MRYSWLEVIIELLNRNTSESLGEREILSEHEPKGERFHSFSSSLKIILFFSVLSFGQADFIQVFTFCFFGQCWKFACKPADHITVMNVFVLQFQVLHLTRRFSLEVTCLLQPPAASHAAEEVWPDQTQLPAPPSALWGFQMIWDLVTNCSEVSGPPQLRVKDQAESRQREVKKMKTSVDRI